ncbi:unnamed protein product [Phytophthora fragariaefolia]|uniref:Unnamed protein product n=1 Tax=Phytophthora fragariaefolia TaxID=1490495 RepID=A0A9W6XYM4_9STRA|nr:unnamed protein product [Phytophthora fragariaefolia]
MVRVFHASAHWTNRFIIDSSDEENTPPNVSVPSHFDGHKFGTQGTTVALWFSPDRVKKRSESSPPAPAKPAVSLLCSTCESDYFFASSSGDSAQSATSPEDRQDAPPESSR